MKKNRLEAFSDGVIAIVITILILDLKVPRESTLDSLLSLWPVYMSWLNHHHIFNNFRIGN